MLKIVEQEQQSARNLVQEDRHKEMLLLCEFQKQNKWIKIATVDAGFEDLNIGVIPEHLAKILVSIEQPNEDKV